MPLTPAYSFEQQQAYAHAFQARQATYLAAGDVAGLLRDCYAPDARFHTFGFRAQGHAALQPVLTCYLARLAALGPRHVDKFVGDRDFTWLELTVPNPGGEPVKTYEVKLLRNNRIYLHLFGVRAGTLWQPGDLATTALPDPAPAEAVHQRYLGYHQAADADGLADAFFAPTARLLTAQVDARGREAIRHLFRALFAREVAFTPGAVRNITHDTDYVWFEASVSSSLGERTVYDVQVLRAGQVSLQLVGQLAGVLPTTVAFGTQAVPLAGMS